MRISFKHVDADYFGVKELICPIADSVILYEPFISIVCQILNIFDTYTEHLVYDVKKALKLSEYLLEQGNEAMRLEYARLSVLLEDFYWNIADDEFGMKIKKFNQDQYYREGLRYANTRLGRYRGLLFEQLVISAVKERFSGLIFATGCQIYIDNNRVIAQYGEGNSRHKETIDIAGWAEMKKYGEFYECKVNPKRFEKENYQFFMELIRQLQAKNIQNYVIGLVSADAAENLKAQKKLIEDENMNCRAEFELIGREDIYNMKKYRIPEIA